MARSSPNEKLMSLNSSHRRFIAPNYHSFLWGTDAHEAVMNNLNVGAEMFAVLFLTLGGVSLGVACLWDWRRVAFGLAVVFLSGGIAAALSEQDAGFWLPMLTVGGGYLLLAAIRQYGAKVFTLLGARHAHAAVILIAGPALAIFWAHRLDRATQPPELDLSAIKARHVWEPKLTPAQSVAHTDQGHVLPLYGNLLDDIEDAALKRIEDSIRKSMTLQVIQTADADKSCNCHGWVFTGGRYSVRGMEVDRILEDNGYTEVSRPQPGDAIVYRSESGTVLHSGVVRVVANDLILIESKWGPNGRFLHAPETQVYSPRWAYYHSTRHGHELQIDVGQ
jgi:hypothetical protein